MFVLKSLKAMRTTRGQYWHRPQVHELDYSPETDPTDPAVWRLWFWYHPVLVIRFYLFLERGEGREKEKERNINVWLPLLCPLLGDLARNPCMCRRPFGLQARAQSTELHQPGWFQIFQCLVNVSPNYFLFTVFISLTHILLDELENHFFPRQKLPVIVIALNLCIELSRKDILTILCFSAQ